MNKIQMQQKIVPDGRSLARGAERPLAGHPGATRLAAGSKRPPVAAREFQLCGLFRQSPIKRAVGTTTFTTPSHFRVGLE
jgi:hypothetical protein